MAQENYIAHQLRLRTWNSIFHLNKGKLKRRSLCKEVLLRQAFARVSSGRIWFWLSSLLRVDTPKQPFIANPRARIFLVSFAMLFFELLCIRWIPSYVRYLSYFNNFILMASFLGIGLGMLSARRKNFWFLPFPLLLLAMVILVALNKFTLLINSTDVLYYGAGQAPDCLHL